MTSLHPSKQNGIKQQPSHNLLIKKGSNKIINTIATIGVSIKISSCITSFNFEVFEMYYIFLHQYICIRIDETSQGCFIAITNTLYWKIPLFTFIYALKDLFSIALCSPYQA